MVTSEEVSKTSFDKSESSDSDTSGGAWANSGKKAVLKEIFQKMKDKTEIADIKEENAKIVGILKSHAQSKYAVPKNDAPTPTFTYEPSDPSSMET